MLNTNIISSLVKKMSTVYIFTFGSESVATMHKVTVLFLIEVFCQMADEIFKN